MTSISPGTRSVRTDDLGSLVVLSWRGTTPAGDVPYLLACSLGDGANGPEATSKAIEQVLAGAGLPRARASSTRPSGRACRSACSSCPPAARGAETRPARATETWPGRPVPLLSPKGR
ncbi:DUF5949 family protein [Streptomyces caelestis]|uniref:DUF5949 family protein n=1 Tax=Streptomyces caelestis TaxID=36816 RepID=UPI0036F59F5F